MKSFIPEKKIVYDSSTQIPHALQELKESITHPHLLYQMVRRDILTRYKRSFLGVAWTMLNPLGTMLVLSIVFSQLFGSTRAYPVFILCGVTAWSFFAQATSATMFQLVWGGELLKRIYIPRATFGLAAIGTGLINLILTLVPLALVMLVSGIPITAAVIFLPVSILFLACFTLGLGLMLSAFAIYFPDVAEMYQIVLTAWMYLTPIIYPETIFPAKFQFVLHLNPMYYLIKLYRLPVYDGRLPTWVEIWPAALLGIGMLIIGWVFFTSKSDEFAYRV